MKYNENRINLLTQLGGPIVPEEISNPPTLNELQRYYLYRDNFIPALKVATKLYFKKINPGLAWEKYFQSNSEIPEFSARCTI